MVQTQTAVEYDKPKVEETISHRTSGVLSKIVSYEFSNHSESVQEVIVVRVIYKQDLKS